MPLKRIVGAGMVVNVLWASAGFASEAKKAPAAEALKNVAPTVAKVYIFAPFHPAMPDHLWIDTGNGRGTFLHFNKPVTDPSRLRKNSLVHRAKRVEGTILI
jgi:hypothetical protein